MTGPLPYKISTLLFLKNTAGEFLLLNRTNPPNKNKWSPIGGKLNMETGESPFECAIRECKEETGLEITNKDLHLF
ncbi:MAG: NUDIX domain-containing protein, partial [Opitutae bacterium]|nr:NUDIX domain-containing protein [Opitutae bacterium]